MLRLASTSPRRHHLLREAGIEFVAVRPEVEESLPTRGDPHRVAARNAQLKAMSVACDAGDLVLAADTVVALGDRLLGKPEGPEQARAMLRSLGGTTHNVVTGVALRTPRSCEVRSVETQVTMRSLSDEEIEAYVASGESGGKAGAYAVQETADRFVTAMEGPYDNVVGLPVDTVREMLAKARAQRA